MNSNDSKSSGSSAVKHPAATSPAASRTAAALFSCIITVLVLLIAAVVYLAFFKKKEDAAVPIVAMPTPFFSANLAVNSVSYTNIEPPNAYNAAQTKGILFDAVQCDTANAYSARTGMYTAPRDGLYNVNYSVVAMMSSGDIPATLAVNVQDSTGLELFGSPLVPLSAPGTACPILGIMTIQLAEGDGLSLNIQLSGGAGTAQLSGKVSIESAYFQVIYLGPGPSPACQFIVPAPHVAH